MAGRPVRPVEMPTGRALLGLLPRLDRARRGVGPALRPVSRGGSGMPPDLALAAGEDADDDPTAFVVSTSGSTAAARAALLTVGNLAASAAATRDRLVGPGGPPAQWLLALPTDHIAGLQVLLRALHEGTEPTVLDTGRPFTPAAFLAAAADVPSGPAFVSLVPTQLHRLLESAEATAALAGFARVLVGGAATAAPLLAAARSAGVRVVTTYGMTETCGGCVYDGIPLDGVRVTADGPVRLQGPVVARGYLGRPDDPAFPGGHTFVTSDQGVLEAGGLRITGRRDDVIVTGGVKIDPLVVEAALGREPGVADVLVVPVPDPEWGQAVTALVVARGAGPDPDGLRRAARTGVGSAAAPKHVLVVDELPRRGIGKPDRTAAAELARERLNHLNFRSPPE